jgi:hypothetical protein
MFLNNIVLRLSALLSGEKIGEHYASVDDRSDYPQHPIPGFRLANAFSASSASTATPSLPATQVLYAQSAIVVTGAGFEIGSRGEIDSTSHSGRRKPVHMPIRRGVPPERSGGRLDQIITWLDANCGADR